MKENWRAVKMSKESTKTIKWLKAVYKALFITNKNLVTINKTLINLSNKTLDRITELEEIEEAVERPMKESDAPFYYYLEQIWDKMGVQMSQMTTGKGGTLVGYCDKIGKKIWTEHKELYPYTAIQNLYNKVRTFFRKKLSYDGVQLPIPVEEFQEEEEIVQPVIAFTTCPLCDPVKCFDTKELLRYHLMSDHKKYGKALDELI